MAWRVPVLRHHDIGEAFREPVDERHDGVAFGDREARRRA